MAEVIQQINNLLIPGLRSQNFRFKLFSDFAYFILLVALPTSFFAFLPKSIFLDLRLLYMLAGIIYGIFFLPYIKKITRIPGGKLLLLVAAYIVFRIFYSLFVDEISLKEVITIFRTNFHYPITALGFLLYAASMDNQRIGRFLHWLFIASLFFSVLYIISNLTGVNFYAVVSKEESQEYLTLRQNLAAIPDYLNVLFIVGLLAAFLFRNRKYQFWWIIPLVLTVLSIVRNQIIVFTIMMFLFVILGNIYFKAIKFNRIVKVGFLLLFISLGLSIVFSAHIGRLTNKFLNHQNEEIQLSKYAQSGTFALRLELIKEAYERTKNNNNLILGNGYMREASQGSYDFVVGSDTLIAPVLYTEGLLGLAIRLIPIFFFLRFGFKELRNTRSPIRLIGLILVVLILPSFVNAVQTKIFVKYTETVLVFYILALYSYNLKMLYKQQINGKNTIPLTT